MAQEPLPVKEVLSRGVGTRPGQRDKTCLWTESGCTHCAMKVLAEKNNYRFCLLEYAGGEKCYALYSKQVDDFDNFFWRRVPENMIGVAQLAGLLIPGPGDED